ncbi:NUDIX hydrolase [Priestia koreensis]|uniref:Nudix hydrolase domain-containing protein n=1 Tax=Priestia koreensis TaxID=284581 RepID=A0A0M0L526_9BACI|nr:NUDIX domain-containing protein [Priestia koreensis]KOO46176.1 hypothetical protein AMD01_09935 [Priestia koreensis]
MDTFYDEFEHSECKNVDQFKKHHTREAVRAAILHNGQILMVHSTFGDYKFPGGGRDEGEEKEEALRREMEEETGYNDCRIQRYVGTIIERNPDDYAVDALFEMTSHYYLCELLTEKMGSQQLDDYEAEQGYTPKWVTLDEAIEQNERLQTQHDWIKRETFVLKKLKEAFPHY